MLKNLRVRTKLIAVLAVPLAGLIVMATIGVLDRQAEASEASDGRELAELTAARIDLAHELQLERMWSASAMAGDRTFGVAELAAQREATDAAVDRFVGRANDARHIRDELAGELDAVLGNVEQLETVRSGVDGGQAIPQVVAATYAQTIAGLNDVADEIGLAARDTDLHGDLASLVALAAAKESLSSLDATVAETLGLGQGRGFEFDAISNSRSNFDAELLRFVGLGSSAARLQLRLSSSAPESLQYDQLLSQVLASGPDGPFNVTSTQWADASVARIDNLRQLETFVADNVDAVATSIEADARAEARNFLLGALAAGFVSLLLASIVARSIARPLTKLTAGAYRLSEERLPALVEQLRNPTSDAVGQQLEPITVDSRDEIGQLADAFNSIQEVTKNVASEQATLLRKGIGDIFVNLARRNQTLLDRQIEFIDQLEAHEEDPDQLENLFKLDHLATRMRRNAESLLVLAGAEPPRRRGRPVDMADVVRVAIGEVEHFARVTLLALDDATVSATVAVDLAHLLSELMENATQFSPPETQVEIVGHKTRDGNYVLSISDQGIGMTPEQLAEANRLLANPPVVGLALSRSLGFTVIGRLAARFGIVVRLTSSPSGGVSALATLPSTLIDVDVFSEPTTSPAEAPEPLSLASPEAPAETQTDAPSLPEIPDLSGISAAVESARIEEAARAAALDELATVDLTAEVPTPTDLGLTPIVEAPLDNEPSIIDDAAPAAPEAPSAPTPAPAEGMAPPPPPPPPLAPPPAAPTQPAAPAQPAQPASPSEPAHAAPNGHTTLPPLPTRVRSTPADSAHAAPPLPSRHPQPVAPEGPTTAGGLTRRVPKAAAPATPMAPTAPVAATQRTPEEVRLMLSRYRSGLRRGRVEEGDDAQDES